MPTVVITDARDAPMRLAIDEPQFGQCAACRGPSQLPTAPAPAHPSGGKLQLFGAS